MIFLDTGFLFALFVEGDDDHDRVQEVFQGFRGQRLQDLLLTTNHVVAETVTLLRKRGRPDSRVRHGLAVSVGEQILAGILGRVHRASADERQRGHHEHTTFTRRTSAGTRQESASGL